MGKRKAEGESKPKSKKEKTDDDDDGAPPKTYQERLKALSPISSPLADEKLTKKLHKLVKKASQGKALRGQGAATKGREGCRLADVIAHLPVVRGAGASTCPRRHAVFKRRRRSRWSR